MVISSNHGNTYQMDHFDSFLVLIEKTEKIKKEVEDQCDQIWRFFGHWAIF